MQVHSEVANTVQNMTLQSEHAEAMLFVQNISLQSEHAEAMLFGQNMMLQSEHDSSAYGNYCTPKFSLSSPIFSHHKTLGTQDQVRVYSAQDPSWHC